MAKEKIIGWHFELRLHGKWQKIEDIVVDEDTPMNVWHKVIVMMAVDRGCTWARVAANFEEGPCSYPWVWQPKRGWHFNEDCA